MSLGKWLSLGVGLAAALLVAVSSSSPGGGSALVALTREGSLAHLAHLVLSAAGLGVALGLLHWLIVSRLDTEMVRLVGFIESLGRSQRQGSGVAAVERSLAPVGMGLTPVAQAAERAIASLRHRNEQLANHRRELEVQLRIADAQRRHGEAILNAITDAVVVTDAFNEVIMVNESAARALGFDLEAALTGHKPVDQVILDPTLVKLIKDTREGGDPSMRRHVEHTITREGHAVVYDVTLTMVSNPAGNAPGEPVGVVTILHDITHEKEVSEMKTEFVSNVSHELRTPLSSIKAYVEMLVDGEAADEATRLEFYNIIQGETNRLQRLIDNILNISRIEAGVVKVQREYVSLPQIVNEVIDVMRPQARARKIELLGQGGGGSPLYHQVFADRDMIYQVVLNLVGNAIKYTPADGKGRVVVSSQVDAKKRTVHVSVSDNGVGIPAADQAHVFDKFYRVQDHKKIAKGTGLGLSLVKQIIETVHGGRVTVQSQSNVGSTFEIVLPLAEGE